MMMTEPVHDKTAINSTDMSISLPIYTVNTKLFSTF